MTSLDDFSSSSHSSVSSLGENEVSLHARGVEQYQPDQQQSSAGDHPGFNDNTPTDVDWMEDLSETPSQEQPQQQPHQQQQVPMSTSTHRRRQPRQLTRRRSSLSIDFTGMTTETIVVSSADEASTDSTRSTEHQRKPVAAKDREYEASGSLDILAMKTSIKESLGNAINIDDSDRFGDDDQSIYSMLTDVTKGGSIHGGKRRRAKNGASSSATLDSSGSSHREETFAKSENKHVYWLRIIVFFVLVGSTVSVSYGMFVTTRQNEIDEFELRFADHSATIVDAFQTHWREGISAIDGMAVNVLSTADAMGSEWPFVTIPHFEIRAATARQLGRFTTLSMVMYVTDENRLKWENYTIHNTQWLADGVQYERETNQDEWRFGNFHLRDDDDDVFDTATSSSSDQSRRGLRTRDTAEGGAATKASKQERKHAWSSSAVPSSRSLQHDGEPQAAPPLRVNTANGIADQLFTIDMYGPVYQPPQTGPYLPVWQHAAIDGFVNYNLAWDLNWGNELGIAMQTQELIVSKALFLADALDTETGRNSADAPVSAIHFPLIDVNPYDKTDRKVVGAMVANLYWDAYMQVGELPETANDMKVVLENACDQSFTFNVENGDILFKQSGDHHESAFDDMRESFELTNFAKTAAVGFANVGYNDQYCPYTLSIYPSAKMRKRYETTNPILYTGLVVAVFVFTSLVFVGYDWFVERRQKVVMKTAVRSHAIVSSLFPKNVRKRLFAEEETIGSNTGSVERRRKRRFMPFRRLNSSSDNDGGRLDASSRRRGPFRAAKGSRRRPSGSESHGAPLGPLVSQKAKLKSFMNKDSIHSESEPPSGARDKGLHATPGRRRSLMSRGETDHSDSTEEKTKPIADLFPNTTVLFADICGFTAWSSTREPSQVFTLLESIYGAFDTLADRRRVFKVETIGDCYMAVTGLPDAQPDHALLMAKFAHAAIHKMADITRNLEVELGPDTTELSMRIGLHSGPVTAGVLRGQKSRFQLFGDTVNTASRMESTGRPNHIQCSEETANLLTVRHKRGHWVRPRDDQIHAKGKGHIKTFWVLPKGGAVSVSTESVGSGSEVLPVARPPSQVIPRQQNPNFKRLLDWNVDLLSKLLKRVVAHNKTLREHRKNPRLSITVQRSRIESSSSSDDDLMMNSTAPRDEYSEFIKMPQFDSSTSARPIDPETIRLKPQVEEQLRDYVTKIACSYRENPFHNYDHASHVTMSANKILMRVVSADDCIVQRASMDHVAAKMHDYTYGITSDPLTHFACVFSALIHDVDHPGVPNSQLIKERDELARAYKDQSVAEQNSIDLAWDLLMDTAYADLRKCLFEKNNSKQHFRQLLVNSVMATDIFDPELKALRNKRWEKAFSNKNSEHATGGSTDGGCSQTNSNNTTSGNKKDKDHADLKATIVIEHIIQAADVSHTMQHWHVYQKWNRRLFNEMYGAFKAGRLDKDPSVGWYKGELWFYDNYIIPLAKKLSDCGVFGVSSDEFLNYAKMNRSEWEAKGEQIVADLKQSFEGNPSGNGISNDN